ncbi:MAG: FecR domain-containing protein, partial [Oscillospiraceae bacterium]|nr:FecR domain-containing protein [Oscillospiraceae bacterium]
MKKLLSLILAFALIAAIVIPILAADGVGTTIRLGQTKGIVAVRNASGNFRSARKDMRLYNGYSVQTAYSSQAYMTLDDTKAAKLDSLSKAEVKKSGKQLEIKLQTGKLYFGVDKPLSSDESLNICTSTMVTGVRGSYGWVEPNLMGLIHGHVTVTCRNPYTGEVRVTEVTSGQIVYFDPYADGAGAEPQLLEIDFIKRLMKNEDVPSFVIEEIRLSPELQELINEDVENLDVPTLLGLEEEKRAAEEAEIAEKEAGIEAAMAEQDAEITGAEQYYVAPTESTSSYIVTLPTGGDYTINGVTGGTMVDATHYSVVSGSTLTFTLSPNAGFSVYEDYLSVSAEGAAVTISQNGTNCDVSFNVYGNRTVSVDSGVFFETDIAGLAAALTAHDEVVLTGTGALAGNQNVANDKTLLLKADLSVSSPNMLTLDAAGTGTNPGKLIIDSGVTLATDNGSTVTNNGKLENYGTANIDGELSSTLGSEIVNYTGGTM